MMDGYIFSSVCLFHRIHQLVFEITVMIDDLMMMTMVSSCRFYSIIGQRRCLSHEYKSIIIETNLYFESNYLYLRPHASRMWVIQCLIRFCEACLFLFGY